MSQDLHDGPETDLHPGRRRHRVRTRILRGTAALPALFTLLNGLAGFASIHWAAKDGLGRASLENLALASWLIVAAMVCDMLDGRLARFARKTSEFGAQLDSLCDMVSFGVAPAFLMLQTVALATQGVGERMHFLPHPLVLERAIWCAAALHVACAAVRLARFNVENEPDESAHMFFKGLPSPGSAACIVALVLLFVYMGTADTGWRTAPWLLVTVSVALPIVTGLCALLMVSTFRYRHVVNYYVRGKRPPTYIVKLVVIVLAAFLWLYPTSAVVILGYVLTGPLRSAWRRTPWGKAKAAT